MIYINTINLIIRRQYWGHFWVGSFDFNMYTIDNKIIVILFLNKLQSCLLLLDKKQITGNTNNFPVAAKSRHLVGEIKHNGLTIPEKADRKDQT